MSTACDDCNNKPTEGSVRFVCAYHLEERATRPIKSHRSAKVDFKSTSLKTAPIVRENK